jgi:hypothetical protein
MGFRLSIVSVVGIVLAGCAESSLRPSEPSSRTVLASFVAGSWNLQVDRAWNGVSGNVQFPWNRLDESDYERVIDGPAYRVAVSDGGRQVTVGERPLRGERTTTTDSAVEFSLTPDMSGAPGGGRLVVWTAGGGLQAELTIYGSGRPIVKSERGAMVPAP